MLDGIALETKVGGVFALTVIVFNDWQSSKAYSPMLVSVEGSVISVSFIQYVNNWALIIVNFVLARPSALVSDEQP